MDTPICFNLSTKTNSHRSRKRKLLFSDSDAPQMQAQLIQQIETLLQEIEMYTSEGATLNQIVVLLNSNAEPTLVHLEEVAQVLEGNIQFSSNQHDPSCDIIFWRLNEFSRNKRVKSDSDCSYKNEHQSSSFLCNALDLTVKSSQKLEDEVFTSNETSQTSVCSIGEPEISNSVWNGQVSNTGYQHPFLCPCVACWMQTIREHTQHVRPHCRSYSQLTGLDVDNWMPQNSVAPVIGQTYVPSYLEDSGLYFNEPLSPYTVETLENESMLLRQFADQQLDQLSDLFSNYSSFNIPNQSQSRDPMFSGKFELTFEEL